MIRVCVVDDQNLVREGIKGLLALVDGIDVVGEAVDGDSALEVIAQTSPDVVLLDLRMPGRDGLGVLDALAARGAAPPCLVLTTFDDDEIVLEAIRRGARGYLLKDVTLVQLTEAVRTLAAGGTLINPAVTERVLRGIDRVGAGFDGPADPEGLTPRETEILRMVAAGYSNIEIAKACFVAPGTVKNHISNILAKLGVRDRTRAVLRGLQLGLL